MNKYYNKKIITQLKTIIKQLNKRKTIRTTMHTY